MKLLCGHDQTVAAWVAARIPEVAAKGFGLPYTAMGVIDRDGALVGGFVFNNYTGPSIQMSLAGRGAIQRSCWAGVADYVFDQLGCVRLGVTLRADAGDVAALAERLGFVYEGIGRNEYAGSNSVRFSLTPADMPAFRKRWFEARRGAPVKTG